MIGAQTPISQNTTVRRVIWTFELLEYINYPRSLNACHTTRRWVVRSKRISVTSGAYIDIIDRLDKARRLYFIHGNVH
jgi:hypothetical protein